MEQRPKHCRHCRGTGIDHDSHFRYTVGGSHDDRRCPECNGDGVIEELPDAEEAMEDTELDDGF